MRRGKATAGALLITALLIGLVVAYGCDRAADHHEGEHHEEHMDGNETGHEGHEHSAVDVPEDAEPSGELRDETRVVQLTAEKFKFTPERIIVKKGEKVRLELTSKDVTHGIAIEAYDIDEEIDPDQTSTVEFTANEAGQFGFHCSVYCGEGHEDMTGMLIVLK